jgi:hypothetical protein
VCPPRAIPLRILFFLLPIQGTPTFDLYNTHDPQMPVRTRYAGAPLVRDRRGPLHQDLFRVSHR